MDGSPNLRVRIAGLKLQNPVLAASGTFAYGIEFAHLVDLEQLGGIVTKGLSLEPLGGAPPPRLRLAGGGMLNAVGLQNIGVRAFVETRLPRLRQLRTAVIANVFGHTIEEYAAAVEVLEAAGGLAGYELNVSCPNTDRGGSEFSADPVVLEELVSRVRSRTRRPLLVKLPPDPQAVLPLARAARQAGADALTIANTMPAMALDPISGKSSLGRATGGLSGPPLRPIALKLVWELSKQVSVPIVACGGIETAYDALQFLRAGATAVQVGTAHFVDPRASLWVVQGLKKLLLQIKCSDINDLIGNFSI
jgi:dihydroorotate dehydrogenase (NAD+) catalytic subunit